MPDPEFGGETGSTRVVKADFLLGMVPPISGHIVVAVRRARTLFTVQRKEDCQASRHTRPAYVGSAMSCNSERSGGQEHAG
jgi:ABC-type antimicrobial peptide transport system ATPase subunit